MGVSVSRSCVGVSLFERFTLNYSLPRAIAPAGSPTQADMQAVSRSVSQVDQSVRQSSQSLSQASQSSRSVS